MTQKTYSCTVLFDASASIEVKASSPEEAAMLAEDACEGRQHLCHQCAKALDTGDPLGVIVCDGDQEVADTTFRAQQLRQVEAERDALIAELRQARAMVERMKTDERITAALDAYYDMEPSTHREPWLPATMQAMRAAIAAAMQQEQQ